MNAQTQQNTEVDLANEYYSKGDLEKAKSIYENLAKDMSIIPIIHKKYLQVMLDLEEYDDAEKYVNRLTKRYPDNIYYHLDLGLVYASQGNVVKADNYYKKVINSIKSDNYKVRIASQYFVNKQLMSNAVLTYQEARRAGKNPLAYSLDLANIYRILNEKDKMVEEYLNYVIQNPANINYVKNSLQNLLTQKEELVSLETLLYEKVQSEPEKEIYGELLIWVNLQQKNFYGAFIQARAIDKRLKQEGKKVLDLGLIALENGDFENSLKIFDYVISAYPGTFNFIKARMYRIQTREQLVKNTFPIEKTEIRILINDYNAFVNEIGVNRTTLDALRNQALLYAFYLDEKDSAINILHRIINTPRVPEELKGDSKLDLGDIYILTNEPWESTLLYSQVEKSMKDTKLGYEAKLRNAKLSYYKGDFSLAQEHLDILKEATTREIANDAMRLSILIKDNTGLDMDSTNSAMKKYAEIDLMLFQNKTEEALVEIHKMLSGYQNHSLTDELWMLQAKIYIKKGEFITSIELLSKIVNEYDYDVLSDDAYFLMGKIYQEQIKSKEEAMKIFQDFLTRYPGSVYSAEARKRFRKLRGDFESTEPILN